jgi:ribosomal protein L37AE/L43A
MSRASGVIHKEDNMDFYQCKKCDRKYAYVVTDMHVPGGKDREYAICPYCKEPGYSRVTSGFIYTYKLDSEGKPIPKSQA